MPVLPVSRTVKCVAPQPPACFVILGLLRSLLNLTEKQSASLVRAIWLRLGSTVTKELTVQAIVLNALQTVIPAKLALMDTS